MTSSPPVSLLLQICPNDHPPFADICRFHEKAAVSLGWQAVTIMLDTRAPEREPAFHYARNDFSGCLATALNGRQPTLVLCHRYRAYRVAMGCRSLGAPLVVVAHEFGLFARRRRRWQLRWDRLRGRPRAAFAGVSDAVARELAEVTGETLLFPNGIDLGRSDALLEPRETALQQLGLSADAFNIGVVGRLHPKKQPLLAIDGFLAAAGDMPEAVLVLVGDGELAADVERRARGQRVVTTGFVADAARLFAAFDLLLVPSGARDAFGMVCVEAMAAGVPVLCGPAPGPGFVVGDCGRRFAAAEPEAIAVALVAACRDWRAGGLAALAARARARVEAEFSLAAAAGRLEAMVVTR